jgi:arylsulfatase A-like enzyme
MTEMDINRRQFMAGLGAGALAFAAGPLLAADGKQQPNIVFILADDLGWMDVSCNGQTRWETPNIDRLAGMGMRFTNAYASAPLCSPTRAATLSGKYPARLKFTGITPNMAQKNLERGRLYRTPANYDVRPAFSRNMMEMDEFTFAEAFREAGYRTGFIGKYHIGGHQNECRRQGFDDIYDFDPRNSQFRISDDGRFCTDIKGDHALEFMEKNKENPFLLYLCTNAVHTRIEALPEYVQHFREKGLPEDGPWGAEYAGFVKHLDDNVGRVIDKVEELGIADSTIIVFMSDNGALGGDVASNAPLRGNKAQLYEGGIREPMIVHWPGVTTPGSTCDQLVSTTDFYPTFLDMAGLEPRPRQHVDGRSFAELCRGGTRPSRPVFWHYPHYATHDSAPCSAVRSGDWKLIKWWTKYRPGLEAGKTEEPAVELYNLAEDMSETTDLAQKMPDKRKELEDLLLAHLKEVDAEMPTANPQHDPAKPFVRCRGRYLQVEPSSTR